MDVSVLETFIDKFKYLWQSGQDAKLTVDTSAGQAWARIDIKLGQAPGPLHHQHVHPRRHCDSPARQRRRERRARDRKVAAAAVAQTVPNAAAEEVLTVEAAVQVVPQKPSTSDAAVQAVPQNRNIAAQTNICPQNAKSRKQDGQQPVAEM